MLFASVAAGSCCRARPSRCWSSPRSCCRAPTRRPSSACRSTRRSSPARSRTSPRTSRRRGPRTGSTTSSCQPFSIDNELDEADVIENDVTLRNIRLWDPNVLETTYQQLQALRPYYEFNTRVGGPLRDRRRAAPGHDRDPRAVAAASRPTPGRTATSPTPTATAWWPRRSTPPTARASRSSWRRTSRRRGPTRSSRRGAGRLLRRADAKPNYSLVRTAAAELDFEEAEGEEQVLHRVRRARRCRDRHLRPPAGLRAAVRRLQPRADQPDRGRLPDHLPPQGPRPRRADRPVPRARRSQPYPAVDRGGRLQWIIDAYTTSNAYPYSERRALQIG